MPLLGVNIDHVATIRQARYRGQDSGEPDPLVASREAQAGGADIITVHLREDRRHIQDADLRELVRTCSIRVNLEMAATDAMVRIALDHRAGRAAPQMCTLVPEGRQEVTTEGGLDVASQAERMRRVVGELKGVSGGMLVSAFIDADVRQVEASAGAGFDACEIHTGPYAAAFARADGNPADAALVAERRRINAAAARIKALGMRLHAGHALNYDNVGPIAAMPGMVELHIGHAIVSRAVFVGLREAVAQMKRCMTGP